MLRSKTWSTKFHGTLLPLATVLAFSITTLRAADAPKPLDAMVEKAMTAYHAGDARAFFADYAMMVATRCCGTEDLTRAARFAFLHNSHPFSAMADL